jgi:hypothetical protein
MNANVANMERQRLREEQPRPELTDDETLEAVHTLMRTNEKYKAAMRELVEDFLILKGETIAINLGLPFPPEAE